MKVIFCRSWLPGSHLIRLLTFSKWSHVAAVTKDGYAIEATWPRVRKVRVEDIIATHSSYEYAEINVTDEAAAWEFLESQVGKKYDLSALLMFINPWRNWSEDDAWFCSELIAAATKLFRASNKVSPQMLYLLSGIHTSINNAVRDTLGTSRC